MAEQEEKRAVYIIPPNFIDTGTLFSGMIKFRNAIEAVFLSGIIIISILKTSFTLTTKIIILCLTALSFGLLALIGIAEESLISFLIHFFLSGFSNAFVVVFCN